MGGGGEKRERVAGVLDLVTQRHSNVPQPCASDLHGRNEVESLRAALHRINTGERYKHNHGRGVLAEVAGDAKWKIRLLRSTVEERLTSTHEVRVWMTGGVTKFPRRLDPRHVCRNPSRQSCWISMTLTFDLDHNNLNFSQARRPADTTDFTRISEARFSSAEPWLPYWFDCAVSLLASHQGEPGSIPGRFTGSSQAGIVLEVPLVGGFPRGSPVSPAPSLRRRSILASITLIGSQGLAVKSCPNLFTHSLTHLKRESPRIPGGQERQLPMAKRRWKLRRLGAKRFRSFFRHAALNRRPCHTSLPPAVCRAKGRTRECKSALPAGFLDVSTISRTRIIASCRKLTTGLSASVALRKLVRTWHDVTKKGLKWTACLITPSNIKPGHESDCSVDLTQLVAETPSTTPVMGAEWANVTLGAASFFIGPSQQEGYGDGYVRAVVNRLPETASNIMNKLGDFQLDYNSTCSVCKQICAETRRPSCVKAPTRSEYLSKAEAASGRELRRACRRAAEALKTRAVSRLVITSFTGTMVGMVDPPTPPPALEINIVLPYATSGGARRLQNTRKAAMAWLVWRRVFGEGG
ncbi:hypothetical protein PR048_016736 [Dryococelus australis]|uniref:Uncharacterized protein n=1 Tax=Dryococelus australis TaxID=614101 RepID=A0ABQ9H7S3_9NEOP|nr:hypothetical protein PR048_016736 [Dryococelus australis]